MFGSVTMLVPYSPALAGYGQLAIVLRPGPDEIYTRPRSLRSPGDLPHDVCTSQHVRSARQGSAAEHHHQAAGKFLRSKGHPVAISCEGLAVKSNPARIPWTAWQASQGYAASVMSAPPWRVQELRGCSHLQSDRALRCAQVFRRTAVAPRALPERWNPCQLQNTILQNIQIKIVEVGMVRFS